MWPQSGTLRNPRCDRVQTTSLHPQGSLWSLGLMIYEIRLATTARPAA
jgi:hypothetical protein